MLPKWLDYHLIKFGLVALAFLVRAIAANNRKHKTKNRDLRPPQSAPAPMPIPPPTTLDSRPTPPRGPSTRPKTQELDSPWSTNKGPFDS